MGENSYEKVSRARRLSKGLCTHAIFGKKSSQLLSSIYLKTSSLKNNATLKVFILHYTKDDIYNDISL